MFIPFSFAALTITPRVLSSCESIAEFVSASSIRYMPPRKSRPRFIGFAPKEDIHAGEFESIFIAITKSLPKSCFRAFLAFNCSSTSANITEILLLLSDNSAFL